MTSESGPSGKKAVRLSRLSLGSRGLEGHQARGHVPAVLIASLQIAAEKRAMAVAQRNAETDVIGGPDAVDADASDGFRATLLMKRRGTNVTNTRLLLVL